MSEDQRDRNDPTDAAKPDGDQQYGGPTDDQNDPQNDQQQTDAPADDQNIDELAAMPPDESTTNPEEQEAPVDRTKDQQVPEPPIDPPEPDERNTQPSTQPTNTERSVLHEPPPPQPPAEPAEVDPTKGMNHMESFHGLIHPDDAKKLLTKAGDFLVRTEDHPEGLRVLLYVFWDGQDQEFPVLPKEEGVTVDHKTYKPTIAELIDHHEQFSVPLNARGVRLLWAVPRQDWELRERDLKLGKKLGEGAFGEVYSGTLMLPNGQSEKVAIKRAKQGLNRQALDEYMKEARIMRGYRHRNIVCFRGISAENELFIVMELVRGGALDSYLKRNLGKVSPAWKARMCFDAACGLQYLHKKGCVHRDIAARNCLIDERKHIVKISDFGLSGVGAQIVDRKKAAPIRWLAPEVITQAFHDKPADVWAFGVLCWEIFSDGEMPYKDLTLAEVRDRIVKEPNFRLTLPPACPPDIRDLVRRCWQSDFRTRATMDEMVKGLSRYSGQQRQAQPGATNNTQKTTATRPTQQSGPMQTASKPPTKSAYFKKRTTALSQSNGSRKAAPARRGNKASAPIHQRSNIKPAAKTPTKNKSSPRPSAQPRPAQSSQKHREPVIVRAPRTGRSEQGKPPQTNQSRVNRSSKKSRKSTK